MVLIAIYILYAFCRLAFELQYYLVGCAHMFHSYYHQGSRLKGTTNELNLRFVKWVSVDTIVKAFGIRFRGIGTLEK